MAKNSDGHLYLSRTFVVLSDVYPYPKLMRFVNLNMCG